MSETKIPCMMLSGGNSRRFDGGRKEFAKLNGQSLMYHVLMRLKDQCGKLAINGDKGRSYEFYRLPMIPDKITGRLGPLAGIHTAMVWAERMGFERVLTCSNDIPFIPLNWAQKLTDIKTDEVVVSNSVGCDHYTSASWPTNLAPILEAELHDGARGVGKWLKKIGFQSVVFDVENGIDPFFNINTNEDLRQAEALIQGLIRP